MSRIKVIFEFHSPEILRQLMETTKWINDREPKATRTVQVTAMEPPTPLNPRAPL